VYIFLAIWFLFSISLFGLTTRKIIDGIRDVPTIFIFGLGFISLLISGLAIYGLFSANLWSIWEVVSQYIFSPYTYGISLLFLLFVGYLIFTWTIKDKKVENLGNLSVALFLLLIGSFLITLPTGLTTGNEQNIYDLQIQGVSNLLTQGASYVLTLPDPTGAKSLSDANNSSSIIRDSYLMTLFALFLSILYFTFRRRKKKGNGGIY